SEPDVDALLDQPGGDEEASQAADGHDADEDRRRDPLDPGRDDDDRERGEADAGAAEDDERPETGAVEDVDHRLAPLRELVAHPSPDGGWALERFGAGAPRLLDLPAPADRLGAL